MLLMLLLVQHHMDVFRGDALMMALGELFAPEPLRQLFHSQNASEPNLFRVG